MQRHKSRTSYISSLWQSRFANSWSIQMITFLILSLNRTFANDFSYSSEEKLISDDALQCALYIETFSSMTIVLSLFYWACSWARSLKILRHDSTMTIVFFAWWFLRWVLSTYLSASYSSSSHLFQIIFNYSLIQRCIVIYLNNDCLKTAWIFF